MDESDRGMHLEDEDATDPRFTVETLFGCVPPLDPPIDIDEQIRLAKEERVEAYIRKFGLKPMTQSPDSADE